MMIDTDYHSHILPGMDDGAADIQTSLVLLSMLRDQGIKTVAATSHFNVRKESIDSFISRRDKAYEELVNACKSGQYPRVVRSAEVALYEGISKHDLRPLCYEGTDLILLEMPRLPYGDWIDNELSAIAYDQKLVPVIAHLDRYMEWYSKTEIDDLLSFEDALIQINTHAFLKKNTLKKIVQIIGGGRTVLLGSDAHDLEKRVPNFDSVYKVMKSFKYRKKILPLLEAACERIKI